VSDFGDFERDDAFDPAPADPEQVARKLHDLRRALEPELPTWTALDADEKAIRIRVVMRVLDWLRRQGSLR
jgi:hypothetical protein